MKSLHPVSEAPPPERTRAFWPNVRALIETIWALFGGPEIIAAMETLSRADHKLLNAWLCRAETLVRKLLFIEAAYVQLAPTGIGARLPVTSKSKTQTFDCDTPELWRVSFKLSDAPRALSYATRSSNAAPSWDARFPQARPLAQRLEALLRVFDAPEKYISRAARLFRRNPQQADALFAAPDTEGYEEIFEPVNDAFENAPRARLRDTT